jgi:DNA-binding beta-propeller fold protein YncE
LAHSRSGLPSTKRTTRLYVGNNSALGLNGGISIIDGATNAVTAANLSALPQGAPERVLSGRRDMVDH